MNEATSQYLYRITLTRPALLIDGPTPQEASVLDYHLAYLERLAADSSVLLAGRTQSAASPFGIVIISETTEAAARDIMDNDPAVKQGIMEAELFPYRIAVMSPQIAEFS